MVISTFNPFTGEKLSEYQEHSLSDSLEIIGSLRRAQRDWRLSLDKRCERIREARERLSGSKLDLARLMSLEMGKPISQSVSEVEKCLWMMDYMCSNAGRMLEKEAVDTGSRTYIRFDPIGVVYLIMPWNFPAWQVLRAAVPALLAGNAVLLKHASIVTGTALKLQEIMGLDVFKTVVMRSGASLGLIEHVDGVSFTGSSVVGAKVAEAAGRNIKKCVLELGGSDPFIVLPSANIEEAAKNAVFARLQNNGQSCIASKRFIVHESIYSRFVDEMSSGMSKVKMGNPLSEDTFLGPVSSEEQKETLESQIHELSSFSRIDRLQEAPGGNFIPPTIVLTDHKYENEVFGPVAIIHKYTTTEEAVRLANDTPYGLGASIWGNSQEAEKLVPSIEAGMVFVNKVVASDPRLPFGGVKKSGIGRELSRYGLLEFTNVKAVWVNE